MKYKYIFTGTEQDLVEAGFDETEIAFYPRTGASSLRWRREITCEKEYREILINMKTKCIRIMDYNRDCTYPLKEEYISDLMDRGLIIKEEYETDII